MQTATEFHANSSQGITWGQEGLPYWKGSKSYFYVDMHINTCLSVHNFYVYPYIHVHIHDFWTRCLQKIFTYQQSVIALVQPLVYSHFEISLPSSELSEGAKHPLEHKDISKSKVRQDSRELSHLQGRQQPWEGAHDIQRAGVWASQTDSPVTF